MQFVKLGLFSLENWEFLEGFPNWEGSIYRTQFIEIDSSVIYTTHKKNNVTEHVHVHDYRYILCRS